jgi:ribonuclease H2 subunit A
VGNIEHYEKKLKMLFPGIACTVCARADSIYPIVSASSIGAKVSRDRQIQTMK